MNLKKIIFYHPSFEKGGVEKILVNLIEYSIKQKIKVQLISSNSKLKKNKYFETFKVKKFDGRLKTTIFSIFILIKILIKNFRNRKATCLLSFQSNSVAICFGKFLGFKVAIRNSEYPLGSLNNNDDNILKSFLIFAQKIIVYNFANLIISNSIGSKNTIKNFIIQKHKVIHIYNPYLKKINKKNYKYKKDVVLFVGRFTKQKGIIYLLKAFSLFLNKFSQFQLWFVGSGPDEKLIKEYIKQNNLNKNIKILPWQKNLNLIYKTSKIFVLPSIYEGLGNVLIEALNHSRACIASDCEHGPSEILMNGKNGYIFKSKNFKSLYKKLIFVQKNFKLAKKKIINGRKNLNRFLILEQSEKYLNALRKV